ncbi:RagB/SusD family nutrient uptake outer membrane protein [Dyadobacter luticola]|uniref:RagB/SusD family nutrient uptake outer membrane protein n=1 Tax=Dyadobacter luticola TaxID=1979387 RepID=A0A5R9L5A8_9BACT|nr:RagB/SusD family nutrient uptake outer membrane protein [Dyadobacter luticola]TLV03754.1 RagB/SusD family nutrient uptake outer membrane protein [Dyadobacter luticola]
MKTTYKSSKRILSLLLTAGLATFVSCKESYLSPEALSFYNPDETFNEAGGLRSALVACERNMRLEWYGDAPPMVTEAIFSDIAVEGTTDKSGPAQNMNLLITPDAQLNNGDYNKIGWYWSEGFKGVKYANVVISRINQPTNYKDEAEKNAILGAAYFHRACRYYRLTQQFGDVPLILDEVIGPKLDFQSTKREVILQKMKEDLEFAEQWVPAVTDKGTVNKGSVSHLLTKINLALGKFDDAIKSATNVIDGGTHKLMTTRFGLDANNAARNVIWDLHRPANKSLPSNTEGLMMVIDRVSIDGNIDGGIQLMRNTVPFWHNNINTPAGNRGTIDTYGIEIDEITKYGRGIGRVRPTYYSQEGVWDDPKDLRHAPGNWTRMEDLVYNNPTIKGTDPYYGKNLQFRNAAGAILTIDTIRCWFDWPNYKLFIEDPLKVQPTGGNTDWYVFRLAETYLLRAEAYTWKGDLANAAKDINAVRARAGAAAILPAKVNIGTVLDERARELYFEEPRKTELTRIAYIFAMTGKPAPNGKTYNLSDFSDNNYFFDRIIEKSDFYNKGVKTRHGDEYLMSPYHVLWPVPQAAISGNTGGIINQNKGYNGFQNNVPPLTEIPK